MLAKIKMAIVTVFVLSCASAALAQPKVLQIKPSPAFSPCVTDEGQGRRYPCDAGGA